MDNILIVIPCLNEALHIEKLVLDLLAANQGLSARIVIADGGSRDRTDRIALGLAERFSSVYFLHNPKRLQAAGVNLAVRMHGNGSEFLIRIDAHAGYPKDYCKILVEEARTMQASSVVVAMDTEGHGLFQRAVAAAQNSRLGNGGSAHRTFGMRGKWTDHGHHALMRLEEFRHVGGYDESFSHNEDAELDLRLKKAGGRIWLTGKTGITYYPRSSPVALFRQYVHYGKGRARTLLKHRMRPKLRQIVPAGVLPAALLALLTPVFGPAGLPLLAWAALCLGYGMALAAAARQPRLALAGVAFLLMHAGWSLGFWAAIAYHYRSRYGN